MHMNNLNLMEIPVAYWQIGAIVISAIILTVRIFYKKHQKRHQQEASRIAARLRFEVYR